MGGNYEMTDAPQRPSKLVLTYVNNANILMF